MGKDKGRNFTESEKFHLLSVIEKYVYIIENKRSDAVSSKKKNEVWEKIANEYNCNQQTGIRNANQLKHLLENIRHKAKKDIASEKVWNYLQY